MRRLLGLVAAAGLAALLLRRRRESEFVTLYFGDGSVLRLEGPQANDIVGNAHAILALTE